ncbi:MAG: 16S rRNA (adenine(1518)-N(6)/adenine(1519)-N(6))-dimethyltransferase RsmA [Actinomycetota bacterium]|nr:16S rRNA (adenine(1518)-N(6)/adenine(1519)-N(6))-dimethyltransferase RsmA [Actinomycetota bacterium]
MSGSDLLGAREIREIAEYLGIRPTKRLGQNFVIDPNTVQRIVRLAGITANSRVLEVGPGLGSLTLALLEPGAQVVAVEIDKVLAEQLPLTVQAHLPEQSASLTVLHADALTVQDLGFAPDALVANLPYNVSVPVLLHLLGTLPSLRTVLVMVQKEVADRLVAGPGSRTYGVPSVKVRWFGDPQAAGNVSPKVFWPKPKVESGLVRITCHAPPKCSASRAEVFSVVDAAFAQRRKSLRAALGHFAGSPAQAELALVAARIDPGARGESLDVGEFARLADALARG